MNRAAFPVLVFAAALPALASACAADTVSPDGAMLVFERFEVDENVLELTGVRSSDHHWDLEIVYWDGHEEKAVNATVTSEDLKSEAMRELIAQVDPAIREKLEAMARRETSSEASSLYGHELTRAVLRAARPDVFDDPRMQRLASTLCQDGEAMSRCMQRVRD